MRAIVAFSFVIGLAAAAPASAHEHEHCRSVHAALTAQVTGTACDSPFGLCTTGSLRGDLHGTTSFTVLTLAGAAGLAPLEPASTLSYLGRFILTTRDGTLTVSDVGLLDGATGAFTEIWRVTGGTGDLAGATGNLWLTGTTTATGGFDGSVTGQLCN